MGGMGGVEVGGARRATAEGGEGTATMAGEPRFALLNLALAERGGAGHSSGGQQHFAAAPRPHSSSFLAAAAALPQDGDGVP